MTDMNYLEEKSRQVPVVADADVIVSGGGPAGVCAAIAAARRGARTVLLERGGCLGGTWTAGALGWIIDSAGKNGLLAEIIEELASMGCVPASPSRRSSVPFDPEGMKLVLETLCSRANVRIRLHTLVADVVKDGAGELKAVVTESKSGREAWRGKVFIDATGDGDLGALSGCRYAVGNPNGQIQPMSLLALVTGVDPTDAAAYVMNYSPREQAIEALRTDLLAEGVEPSYHDTSLFHLGGELYFLMANHQYGGKGTDADDVTRATLEARREIHRQVETLRRRGGVWEKIQLAATAEHIGVREGRRIKGLYEVSLEDLKSGARHADAVCRSTFCVDVHALDASTGGIEVPPCAVKPYDIPLRALISADVPNLMMAGRCISGDFYAHASYRVTGNAAVLGEAAGVCATIAAKAGKQPRDAASDVFFSQFGTMVNQQEGVLL
ncbi:FAD-dependent oxidoreductase [Pontiella sp.]|uniref:FAD-dependent oxidoreductase n=1 Tax=Pontiella sp. TaxID=2837462 RepID=UPI003561885D